MVNDEARESSEEGRRLRLEHVINPVELIPLKVSGGIGSCNREPIRAGSGFKADEHSS